MKYYFRPCGNTDACGPSVWTDGQVCVSESGSLLSLGRNEQSAWTLNADGSLILTLLGGDDYINQCYVAQSTVTAQCGSGDNSFALVSAGSTSTGCTWTFSFNSADLCAGGGGGSGKGGLSGGWIFIIVLIVVSFVYFAGGALFMRYRMGASGVEMVPNLTFWRDLPGLVKDGCSFSWQKVKGWVGGARGASLASSGTGSTYETI